MTRSETRARYAALARDYVRHWAPVLIALARPLLARLSIQPGQCVLDIGCGPGAISSLCARRAGVPVVGIDSSLAMLRRTRRRPVLGITAEAEWLPLPDETFDVALSTFMLQHVPKPGLVFKEAARVLRPDGVFGTATWHDVDDETGGPYDVADAVLDRAGAPSDGAAPLRTYHKQVSRPEQLRRYARAAGFGSIEASVARGKRVWTTASFTAYAEVCGPFSRRLATLPETRRRRALEEIARGVAALPPDQMVWRPRIVYCIARR